MPLSGIPLDISPFISFFSFLSEIKHKSHTLYHHHLFKCTFLRNRIYSPSHGAITTIPRTLHLIKPKFHNHESLTPYPLPLPLLCPFQCRSCWLKAPQWGEILQCVLTSHPVFTHSKWNNTDFRIFKSLYKIYPIESIGFPGGSAVKISPAM